MWEGDPSRYIDRKMAEGRYGPWPPTATAPVNYHSHTYSAGTVISSVKWNFNIAFDSVKKTKAQKSDTILQKSH